MDAVVAGFRQRFCCIFCFPEDLQLRQIGRGPPTVSRGPLGEAAFGGFDIASEGKHWHSAFVRLAEFYSLRSLRKKKK
ncbi:hypothetical protein AK812_SmicGene37717 [Symbiodinium microadriaticum]|uniref:Uncharacterized protein n=1 Tax=Symbiodinium microadriaticum TaxID=2951 RepID=A0A1Q9CFL3_SYMMI|nr:hypothetical protein AK812_SmicGene37717 [Symbiodinium microadriaticum]